MSQQFQKVYFWVPVTIENVQVKQVHVCVCVKLVNIKDCTCQFLHVLHCSNCILRCTLKTRMLCSELACVVFSTFI